MNGRAEGKANEDKKKHEGGKKRIAKDVEQEEKVKENEKVVREKERKDGKCQGRKNKTVGGKESEIQRT